MKDRVILDLCGGTGSWSRPYKEAGYGVRVITLPDYDVTKVEFCSNAMHFIRQNVHYADSLTVLYEDVYGILAAPPCTEFSIAKGNAQRNFEGAMEIVQACLNIIWQCRIHGNLKFWALENPRGFLRQFIGIPSYTFEQWQFGGNKRKATDIWGYFKHPTTKIKEFPTELVKNDGRERAHAADWTLCEYPPEYTEYINQFKGDEKRAACRAITPPGFAEAFFKANR